MKILNGHSGLGGNRRLWECEGIKVTAVELEPGIAKIYKDNFPDDEVIVGDVHEYLLENSDLFDFIWLSPPCQTHSKMMKATRHKKKRYTDLSMYQYVLFLQHFFKGKYVVENVKPYYEPLIKPTIELGRHIFFANFTITPFEIPNYPNFIKAESPEAIKGLKKWLGINYEGNIYYKDNHSPGQILRNCVHPETGLHILNCARGIINQPSITQTTLF